MKMLKIMMMLLIMSHLNSSTVLAQGPDHHSVLGLILCEAEAKTNVILEGGSNKADNKIYL